MGKRQRKTVKSTSGNSHVVKSSLSSTIRETPIWRFDKLDRDGKFAFDLSRSDFKHREVLQKLIDYGAMTWADIEHQQHDRSRKTKHHYISPRSLSVEAIARVRAKHLEEDIDTIFSFSLQNRLRIVGIRHGAVFHIVWYDPNHEFCPGTRN